MRSESYALRGRSTRTFDILRRRLLAGGRQVLTPQFRRLAVEPLEDRRLLTMTLGDAAVPFADTGGLFPTPLNPDLTTDYRFSGNTNLAPVAERDVYAADADTVLAKSAAEGVLANDLDRDGNPLTVSLVAAPLHGVLALHADGSFEYTPAPGFRGTDQFTYLANDGLLNSTVPGIVDIHVGPPQLLKDLNPATYGSEPGSLVAVGDVLYFLADDGVHGPQLWRSDGTPAGTMIVKNSLSVRSGSLTNVNGMLYFAAYDASTGYELWKSDGTEAGTVRVKDIWPGTNSSSPAQLTNVNGTLYFSAYDSTTGNELWKSNGTEAGTERVKDINPGMASSDLYYLTNVGGTLYFQATDASAGRELWKSEGTEATTVMVKDITPGTGGSDLRNLTAVNSTLYFATSDAVAGYELWKSDGTEASTVMVKDINPGTGSSSPDDLTNVDGTLYFSARDPIAGEELWKSEGTEATTVMVKDIYAGGGGSCPTQLTNVNGTLYFAAYEPIGGWEVWKSNGSEAGTVLLKDIDPYPGWTDPPPDFSLTNVNGTLFFASQFTPSMESELWKSDGSEAGTVRVKDINPGQGSSSPYYLTNVNGTLFFRAEDSSRAHELWKSDGSEAGTVCVKDINAVGFQDYPSLANVEGTLYFTAGDSRWDHELWKTDGTPAGTVRVKDVQVGTGSSTPASTANVGGTLYFSGWDSSSGWELWKSDGTEATTVMVKDINPGVLGSNPASLTNVGGTLYFSAWDSDSGWELWKSDGTEATTVMVKDITPGTSGSDLGNLTDVNGILYFSLRKSSASLENWELWRSNGTEAGTVRIQDFGPAVSGMSTFGQVVNVNGTLYFCAYDAAAGWELWKSDGTEAGTVRVKDIEPGLGSSNPGYLTDVNGLLYFAAGDFSRGWSLWQSDGTELGTVCVKDREAGASWWLGGPLTNINGMIYFSAYDSSSGYELWKSDGTEAGTVRVKDIDSGGSGSSPECLTDVNGTLYFRAKGSTTGWELWRSDGTEAGTVLVADINPGTAYDSPDLLTVAGDNFFFTATDGWTGTALWSLPVNVSPTDIHLAPRRVAEHQPAGTVVGTLTTADPAPALDSHTYSLVSGPGDEDNGLFAIVGDQLRTSAVLDYETNSARSIRLRSSDAWGGWVEQTFTIDVSLVNAGPSLGGMVWNDRDADGVQDTGEPRVRGAVVELFSSADGTIGNADDLSYGAVVTDRAGAYLFPSLTAEVNYYLVFRAPVGDPAYVFTAQDIGDDAADSDADASGATAMLRLNAGQDRFDLDAGLVGVAPGFGYALRAGATSDDQGQSVASDALGNVYVTGYFQGTVDFDHGPREYLLTSAGYSDSFVAKYSPTGALVWARRMGGTGYDNGSGIAVAGDGSVYTTGVFGGTVDFDPGPGEWNLTCAGDHDIFVSKLDSAGNFVWARSMGGTNWDVAYGITVAADGSVLTTGYFFGTADFDPGPGVFNLTTPGSAYVFVSKLDAEGNMVWAQSMGGSVGAIAEGIAVAGDGSVYTTGYFAGTVDFDPGLGTFDLTSAGDSDIFVSKLDSAGDFVWACNTGASDWNVGYGIAVAQDGSVYATGRFLGTADFDPGPGTFNLTSAGGGDIFISKLDSAGDLLWARSVGGAGYDTGNGITLAADGSVYTTGSFIGTADFDPGPDIFNLTSSGDSGVFVSRLDSAGNFVWAKGLGGTGSNAGRGIAVVGDRSVYATGYFYGTADFDPGPGVFPLASAGNADMFLCKLSPNEAPTDIALTNSLAPEHRPRGTVVGVLTTIDPDLPDDAHTYALVSGSGDADNASFAIVGDQLKTAAVFNYEARNAYSIRVRTTDSRGLSYEKALAIAVEDGNEAPVAEPGGPYLCSVGQDLVLDGSASFDPDTLAGDSIVSYEWDFGADGSFDFTGVSPTVPWQFLMSAWWQTAYPQILLRVTDTQGATGTALTSILPPTRIVVTTLADENDNNDPDPRLGTGTSLHEAIEAANRWAGPQTIEFSVTGTILLNSELPWIQQQQTGSGPPTQSPLVIQGPGPSLLTVQRNSNAPQFSVFSIGSPNEATISGLTVSGGYAFTTGGGFSSSGRLTVDNCVVADNVATVEGGGIAAGGTLTVTNSVFRNNTAVYFDGGALSLGFHTTATITNCTFTSNSTGQEAMGGGAIFLGFNSTLTISNSTFSSNSAGQYGMGGAVCLLGPTSTLTVSNSTFSNNTAPVGGAFYVGSGGTVNISSSTVAGNVATNGWGGGFYIDDQASTVNAKNTIIAGNSATQSGPDVFGPLTSQGHNLIQDASDATIGGDTTGNILGQDPLLGPLQDNGGPTWTMALLEGSPALDAGDNSGVPLLDQRGLPRIVDGDKDGTATTDIGAVEMNATKVVGRYLFYNNSAWDGNNPAADDQDYAAIAPSPSVRGHGHAAAGNEPNKELGKQALLPGQTASFVNYTSFSKGINGIIIAFDNLPNPAALTTADFVFRAGNGNTPADWSVAPAPASVRVHENVNDPSFPGNPDVVTITWADENPYTKQREPGAISNQWLQVTVLASAVTGLSQQDVFYWGNQLCESGNSASDTNVDTNDEIGARNHPHTAFNKAPLADPYDYNRDKKVDTNDEILARNNSATAFTRIKLIAAPPVAPGATGSPAALVASGQTVAKAHERDYYADPLSLQSVTAFIASNTAVTLNPDKTITYDSGESTAIQGLSSGPALVNMKPLKDQALLSTVGHWVWNDLNSNGVQEAGEPGVAGALVEVFSSPDGVVGNADDVSEGVAITDADGNYWLGGLTDGINYYLVFRTPVGYTFTTQHAGTDATLDSDADAVGVTAMFTLDDGQNRTDLDAGMVGAAPAFGFALRAGATGADMGFSVAADPWGNVYVAGRFMDTADFDPGPGVYSLTTAGLRDAFVAKYSPTGALAWVRNMGGTGNDGEYGIAVAADGSVYSTGVFNGTADFDPGPAVYNLTAAGGSDIFVSKLDSAGHFVWARNIGGDEVYDVYWPRIAVAADGSVYIAGYYWGPADFDPGVGTFILTSAGDYDAFVCKLDSAGDFVWARSVGGTGYDFAESVSVAADGSVYTTGYFEGTSDFDPGPGTFNLTSVGSCDIFVSKLDSAGNFVWARSMGGTGSDLVGYSIAIGADGCVVTTGLFRGTADFDPGPGTCNLTSAGSQDAFVSKLDSAGNFVWARGMGGSSDDRGVGIALASDGSIYATGYFQGTADFDPGPGTFNLTSAGSNDIFVSKLDTAGNFAWAVSWGGSNSDETWGIAVAADGSVLTTGQFYGTADFDPGPGTLNLTAVGTCDVFVSKLRQYAIGDRVWNDLNGNGIQDSGEPGVAGAVVELYSSVDGTIGNADDVLQGRSITDANGNYTINGALGNGTSYYLIFRSPVGYTFTTPDIGDDALDSDANASGLTAMFTLDGGQNRTDLDAGLVGAAPGFGFALSAGAANNGAGRSVATDGSGNVYVTGSFSGEADFDPGPGVCRLIGVGADAFVAKYSPSGALVWARSMGGTGGDGGSGIAVGADGNVYTTGNFEGMADFDPGAGTFNLTSVGSYDVFVSKLDPAGNFVWARSMGGTGGASGYGIAMGPDGNVYTTGTYSGTADFDPGPGTFNLTSAGSSDIFVSKLDPAGNFVWTRSMGGTNGESGYGIAVGPDGDVYTTGYFMGTADFDPGPGTFTFAASGTADVFVSKLDSAGGFVWARRVGGAPGASISVADGIAIGNDGSVHTLGRFVGTADFDPGPGTYNLTCPGACDIFVWKLDSAGDFVWARSMGGTGLDEDGGIALGRDGSVYTTGHYEGTADFDPGPGTFNLSSAGNWDAFVSKLDSAGDFVWARSMGGTGGDSGCEVAVAGDGSVYTTGFFQGTADFDPGAGTFNLTAAGSGDVFVSKFVFNQSPAGINLSSTAVSENQPVGTLVGDFSTTDPDLPGDSHNYTLVDTASYPDNASFIIAGNQLKTAAPFDYETKSSYSIRVRSTDSGGLWREEVFPITVLNMAEVVGRYLFYNNSAWDGNNPAADDQDYAAIAPSPSVRGHGHAAAGNEPNKELGKQALLPGQTASFVNYTSFSKGINGIIVAFDNLADAAALTAADFVFRVGNSNTPADWSVAPAPASIRVHENVNDPSFPGNPDVVTITWADENPYTKQREPGAISNQWLQVTVLASAVTGLSQQDVFYWGNQICESGNSASDANVDTNDEIGARNHPHTAFNKAPLADPYDYNRDKKVDTNDEILARNNPATAFTRIKLIAAPPVAPGATGSAAALVASGQTVAKAHDAVFQGQAVGKASAAGRESLAPLAWLDALDRITAAQSAAKKDKVSRNTIDQVLATYGQ